MFMEIFKAAKAPKPYGNVKYADPKDGKYPVDTEGHIRAAWSYINHPDNYKKLGKHAASTKHAIVAAWKAHLDKKGPPGATKSEGGAPADFLRVIGDHLPAEVVQKAAKPFWHKDGSKCSGKNCDKAHYEEPWEPGEGVVKADMSGLWPENQPHAATAPKPMRDASDDARARQRAWDGAERIVKADIGSSDLAVAGRLNPEQKEAKAPGKKMRHGAAFDRGIPPKTSVKKDSTRPLPRPDTGLSAPILTGSFASGKGQSTMGVGGTRYDPTAPGKYPSSPDPVTQTNTAAGAQDNSQKGVPSGPTYAGVFEKSKNLQKKIKVEALPAYKLEEDQSAGNKPATDTLSQPRGPGAPASNPATLGKGIAQTVKVTTVQDSEDGKIKHYMGEDGKHVATAHEQMRFGHMTSRGTRPHEMHHSLTLHPDGPEGDKKMGPWIRGKAPHSKQVSDLIAENYKPSPGT